MLSFRLKKQIRKNVADTTFKPVRLLIRQLEQFLSNKRKDLSPFRTDVLMKSHIFGTLGAGAPRNRKIMKPVRTLILV